MELEKIQKLEKSVEKLHLFFSTGYERQPKSGSKTYLRYGTFIKK